MQAQQLIDQSKRIIIKIGSALVINQVLGTVRMDWLHSLAQDIQNLLKQNKQIIIVSSGAIALGRKNLGIDYAKSPSSIPLDLKQASAAVGQISLVQAYHEVFKSIEREVGQILLTPSDTENRRSHLNARATIMALLEKGIIPVINENDTVSTAEIRFGDNDRLAARVAQMIEADCLIQLSTTDGLYTSDPSQDADAEHIPLVEDLHEKYFDMASDALSGVSTGGMKSKLEAARIATQAGTHMVIAKGTSPNPLSAWLQGAKATIFRAKDQPLNARKRWIQAHIKPVGAVVIDDGAAKALKNGKSLLAAGITSITGDFEKGDAVTIKDINGNILGLGLSAYDAKDAVKIMGKNSDDFETLLGYLGPSELIHRNDMVLV